MPESNLSFAKIVANPSAYSWSQVYNAGKLFAVLSLETSEETKEKDYLNVLGKEILDTLEQEFFTLETKDLDSIKEAVLQTSQKIPENVTSSFVIVTFVNNILYIYILGNGKVSLKRDGRLGNLLEANDQKPDSLKLASGFLQDNDVVILQTKQFCDIISIETLSEFLDNLPPSEAAENLAPLVHEKEESGAASIIIGYKAPLEEEEITANHKPKEEASKEQSPFYSPKLDRNGSFLAKIEPLILSFFSKLRLPLRLELNHPRKVILTIVLVIIVVFVGSIAFALKKQQDTKTQEVFASIYPEASKKYEEGESLMELNQNLARESFSKAQGLLESGKDKLPKDSSEEKKVLELLAKVNSALGQTSGVTSSNAKQVDSETSSVLLQEIKNSGLYFSQDNKNIYGLTNSSVFSLSRDGSDKKTIIESDQNWKRVVGVFPYNGNIYVLDADQNQIFKYVPTSSGFSNTNYFSTTKPDFSNAVSLAIDSSIYVLSLSGNVDKFTRGNVDNFSLSGLDKKLLNPTRIFTDADTDNIYILDNGNLRIVVFDKTGSYKSQYQATVIGNAKDFDVLEKDKKVFILSSGKVYEIDLK